MKRIVIILLTVICFGLRMPVHSSAPTYTYSLAQRKLYKAIRRHKAAVILLSAQQKNKRCRRSQKIVSPVHRAFAQLKTSGYYPRKAVTFLHIDAQSPVGKAFCEDNDLNISDTPAIVLFSDGVPVEDQHGIVTVAGNTNRSDLKKTIDEYLNLDIAQFVQEERAFKQYQDIIRDRAHVYYSPYFSKVANPWNGYWGWPYYGMAQGHYGGNVGVVSSGNGLSFFGANY